MPPTTIEGLSTKKKTEKEYSTPVTTIDCSSKKNKELKEAPSQPPPPVSELVRLGLKRNGAPGYGCCIHPRKGYTDGPIPVPKKYIDIMGLERACIDAMEKYNAEEKTQLEYVNIITARKRRTQLFFIMFTVKDPLDNHHQIFKARVFGPPWSAGPYEIEEVRLAPHT